MASRAAAAVSCPTQLAGPGPTEPARVGSQRDPRFIERALPLLELVTGYFRPEVLGVEHLPEGAPFLLVGNHSGGVFTPDMYILIAAWFRARGLDVPAYGLAHRGAFLVPGIRSLFGKLGAIEARLANAERALDQGAAVLVYPGGDWEAFRPWRDRNKIDLAGHKGFIRLALKKRVPLVPAVAVGSHESVIILSRGERAARALRLDRLLRLKVLPVSLTIPWGIVFGFLPGIPLPAKITICICPPMEWDDLPSAAADDREVVDACYEEVVTTMQLALDGLAAARRFPVIG